MATTGGANVGSGNKSTTATNAAAATGNRVNSHRGAVQSKNSSSTWDTDFDGAWEMGRDLIREFVMKQNSRNRSISESDACKFVESQNMQNAHDGSGATDATARKCSNKIQYSPADGGGLAAKNNNKHMSGASSDDDNLMQVAAAATSSIFHQNIGVDQNIANSDTSILMVGNLIRPEGYATPDTLSSLASDVPAPRRLYEREVSSESINAITNNVTMVGSNDRDRVDDQCDESSHLAAFEAKFNRNVEALWDDSKDDEQQLQQVQSACLSQPMGGNVESFWFNYYKHHYNSDDQSSNNSQLGFASMYPMSGSDKNKFNDMNNMNSLPNFNANKMNADRYSNLNQLYEMAPSQTKCGHMNLTSSIWSDTVANNESDLSFYANAAAIWDKGGSDSKNEQSYKVCFWRSRM